MTATKYTTPRLRPRRLLPRSEPPERMSSTKSSTLPISANWAPNRCWMSNRDARSSSCRFFRMSVVTPTPSLRLGLHRPRSLRRLATTTRIAAHDVGPVRGVERRRPRPAPPRARVVAALQPGAVAVVVRPRAIGMLLADPALSAVARHHSHPSASMKLNAIPLVVQT